MVSYDRTILVLSLGFFGIFLAFNTTQALQSTLNASLGTACLATLYAAFTAVCIPGPRLVSYLKPKNAMILGGSMYVLMIVANIAILNLKGTLWAQYLVGIPFNLLVGVGAPLLWTGQAVYLNNVAEAKHTDPKSPFYSQASSRKIDTQETKEDYNGTFYAMFQLNGVVGLLFASILKTLFSGDGVTTVLFIVLSIAASLGVFAITLLPNSMNEEEEEEAQKGTANIEMEEEEISMSETLSFLVKEPRIYLLVPIIIFNGMSLGFMFSDYTKYVIGESLGDGNIGFVTATFYAVNTVACKVFGTKAFVQTVGRRGLYIMAFVLQAIFFIFFLWQHKKIIGYDNNGMSNFVPPKTKIPYNGTYTQDDDNWLAPPGHAGPDLFAWVFVFLMAALFALGDAVLESVVPATLQNYFAGDAKAVNASAANQKMWQSLGFAAQFAIGAVFPSLDQNETVLQHFQLKLIILTVLLFIGYALALFTLAKYPIDANAEDAMDDPLMEDPLNESFNRSRRSSLEQGSMRGFVGN